MNDKPLEIMIGNLLRRRGWCIAMAESCTGGRLGDRITNIPGASDYFEGNIIAYSYEAKVRLLGVKWTTLERHGAVSEAVALEMVRGVRRALATEVGVSITGIAGPSGGTAEKPVGLTWIGISTPHHEETHRFVWDGNRLDNKEKSVQAALNILVKTLS